MTTEQFERLSSLEQSLRDVATGLEELVNELRTAPMKEFVAVEEALQAAEDASARLGEILKL